MDSDDAIQGIERRAVLAHREAEQRWTAPGTRLESINTATQLFSAAGRVTVNFHPDRMCRSGTSVAAGLAADGFYRSQWVTGVSAGSRSAMVGGERNQFERKFFDGAYEGTDPESGEHPVYGAIDLLYDDLGGSPRFGSCYLVLEPHVRDRTTLSLGDSYLAPPDVGTFQKSSSVLAGLLEQANLGALLNRPLGNDALTQVLSDEYRSDGTWRDLDGYVEAQIHGELSLADDVAEMVIDPSFLGTAVERDLSSAARRSGVDLKWHTGSELAVEVVPDDFRGPNMPRLAEQVAGKGGVLDAAAIGRAASKEPFDEPLLLGDLPDAPLQQLKRLWHTLVAYGSSADQLSNPRPS